MGSRAAFVFCVVLLCGGAALATGACGGTSKDPAVPSSSGALIVPPIGRAPAVSDPSQVRFAEGASVPSGCFAIARRSGTVACIVGEYGGMTSERKLTFLSGSDQDVLPDVAIDVVPPSTQLERESRETLDSIMREGDFVPFASQQGVTIPLDTPRVFGGFTIELKRQRTHRATSQAWDVHVTVRHDKSKDRLVFENTLADVDCESPTLSVRSIETSTFILERECRDSSIKGGLTVMGAWLCNDDKRSCD